MKLIDLHRYIVHTHYRSTEARLRTKNRFLLEKRLLLFAYRYGFDMRTQNKTKDNPSIWLKFEIS